MLFTLANVIEWANGIDHKWCIFVYISNAAIIIGMRASKAQWIVRENKNHENITHLSKHFNMENKTSDV